MTDLERVRAVLDFAKDEKEVELAYDAFLDALNDLRAHLKEDAEREDMRLEAEAMSDKYQAELTELRGHIRGSRTLADLELLRAFVDGQLIEEKP